MKSPSFLGSNINLIKAHNLRAILLSLLNNEVISRVEIARQTELSTTTITNLTAELLEEGIILEQESFQEIETRRRVGRPRTMLRLVPDARYAVGVHIGIGLFRVAIANLHAEILHNNMSSFELGTPPHVVMKDIADMVRATIVESGVDPGRVIGVGVGASGLVDYENGVNVLAHRLGWRDVPIAEMLHDQLGIPVCVDNNVRSMALGEAFFGAGRDVGVLAFVYGRVGVGAGLVVNGQLFHGSGAGAGEIGHTTMLPFRGELCTCGNRGCLETLVSEPVLVARAQALALDNPGSILAQVLEKDSDEKAIDRIIAAASDGDENAKGLFTDLASYLGIALANLVNVFNPEMIILGGMFSQSSTLILPVAETTMRARAFADLGEKAHIVNTSFGWQAGVTGAAALALTSYFYQY